MDLHHKTGIVAISYMDSPII